LCAGLLFGWPAPAQSVVQCQPSPPFANPQFADGNSGFSPNTPASAAARNFAVGDIDGDGNDELVTVVPVQNSYSSISQNAILVSRWIQSGWSPMQGIPNTTIFANSSFGETGVVPNDPRVVVYGVFTPLSVQGVTLADVDGDGTKELIVSECWHYNGGGSGAIPNHCQDQVYKYAYGAPVLLTTTADSLSQPYHSFTGPSIWFKARSTDKQFSRFIGVVDGSGTLNVRIEQYVNGSWVSLQGDQTYTYIRPNSRFVDFGACVHSPGCLSFSDVNGDGLADLVFVSRNYSNLGVNTFNIAVQLSTSNAFFGGASIVSNSIPVLPSNSNNSDLDQTVLNSLQMGDIDGDGKDELIYATPDGRFHAYYWNPQANDFAVYPDSGGLLVGADISSTFTIVPKPFFGGGILPGVAAVGSNGVSFLPFRIINGARTQTGTYVISQTISSQAGFGPSGYSGYFRIPVENGNLVLLARSANGLVLENFGTVSLDKGYLAYTTSGQKLAYQYISGKAAGNIDIRSLYPDPAIPWASVQYKVETMAAPSSSTGISAADFQVVQKQTIDELTAVQAVNNLYGITGLILTNTYLVRDAALTETTSVLGLSSQPDVAQSVLNIVTTALGNLGTALSFASSAVQLTKDATQLADIINKLNAASNVSYLMGAVTGDIATYAAPTPADLSTGTYDLKTALDNASLAVATSNACHQLAALSSWNQSKFIADSLLTGTIPLDLATQQDLLQAGQALFRLHVWQALVPSKWSSVSVKKLQGPPSFCQDCLFTGNASYPKDYSIQARASCSGDFGTAPGFVSLILEDPSTHNYPNLTAMKALFDSPPDGLGAHPSDLLLNNNGWSVPYQSKDDSLSHFLLNTGYVMLNCSNFSLLSPQITPNSVEHVAQDNRRPVRRGIPSADAQLAALIADAKEKLIDTRLRDRLVMFLEVASDRLKLDQLNGRDPDETIRLLNVFITQSQFHAEQGATDSEISRAESIQAVAIRDSLLAPANVVADQ
jgi:hypothetical protein